MDVIEVTVPFKDPHKIAEIRQGNIYMYPKKVLAEIATMKIKESEEKKKQSLFYRLTSNCRFMTVFMASGMLMLLFLSQLRSIILVPSEIILIGMFLSIAIPFGCSEINFVLYNRICHKVNKYVLSKYTEVSNT